MFSNCALFDPDVVLADTDDVASDVMPLKEKKAKKTTNLHPFLADHPLSESHAMQCSTLENAMVLNFIGPVLPHVGHEDRKYCCMAMLSMFKPYRLPSDLKDKDQTWDEAFESHKFTLWQLQLLKNFNLKYECLNTRDNFHTQMCKGLSSFIPSWGSTDDVELVNELGQQHSMSETLESVDQVQVEISSIIGSKENTRRLQVAAIDNILRRLRLDQTKSMLPSDLLRDLPSIIQGGSACSVYRSGQVGSFAQISHDC